MAVLHETLDLVWDGQRLEVGDQQLLQHLGRNQVYDFGCFANPPVLLQQVLQHERVNGLQFRWCSFEMLTCDGEKPGFMTTVYLDAHVMVGPVTRS